MKGILNQESLNQLLSQSRMLATRGSLIWLLIVLVSVGPVVAQDKGTEQSTRSPDSTLNVSDIHYLEFISNCYQNEGPFDQALSDQLLNLGNHYKDKSDYEKASQALKCSLHVKKVIEGQETLNLVPILDALIGTHTAAQNWDELDNNYELFFYIHQQNLDPNDPALLNITDLVSRWKLIAYKNRFLSENTRVTINDLIELYNFKIEKLEVIYGETDSRLIVSLKGLAISQYELVNNLINTPLGEFEGIDRRHELQQPCNNDNNVTPGGPMGPFVTTICDNLMNSSPNFMVDFQVKKRNLVSGTMQEIKNTLLRIKEIYELAATLQVEDYVKCLLDLGDWYFINDQRSNALVHYDEAYQIIRSHQADKKTMVDFFSKPVLIPAINRDPSESIGSSVGSKTGAYVRLTFDVNKYGKTSRIKVIEQSNPENFMVRKKAREYIKTLVFRPKLVEGKPVHMRQMEYMLAGNILN